MRPIPAALLLASCLLPVVFIAGCGGGTSASNSAGLGQSRAALICYEGAESEVAAQRLEMARSAAGLATPTPTVTSPPGVPPLSTPIPLQEGHTIGTKNWGNGPVNNGGTGQVVDGLNCGVMDYTYHVHAHLSIFLDGVQLAVPAQIGIKNPVWQTDATYPDGFITHTYSGGCYYAMHGHDTSGKIHLEAPAATNFTLGQYFHLWGKTLSATNVAGYSTKPIVFYVKDGDQGVPAKYTGDPMAIALHSHTEVTIQIGKPIAYLPTYNYWGMP